AYAGRTIVVFLRYPRIGVVEHGAGYWGVFPPYAAAVEAAAVRNRWGDTSTPIVSRVILEISVPRFFVVSRPPVVEEIQRAFVGGLDPSKSGRDWLRYSSIKRLSNAGTRRSSGRRDFVRWPGKAIHQLPSTSLNVCPISRAPKFFSRIGQSASKATMRPLRTPRAQARSLIANSCASATNVRPASTSCPVSTRRSNFDLGSISSARSFSISASQEKSNVGASSWAARRS